VSISIPGRVVVFDYGEVISKSPSDESVAELERISGHSGPEFWVPYWNHREALDQGRLSVTDYWAVIAGEFGETWSPSTVQALWVADFFRWMQVEPGTFDLLAELHAGGTRLAILSNAGFDYASAFRHSPMGNYFERIFLSAEMDSVKPDPAIYIEVADELGITLDQMVFIDNKSINTDAAAELGVTVHHFTSVSGLDAFLRSLAS
jgi:putative hydrolase of the HAD superfamily